MPSPGNSLSPSITLSSSANTTSRWHSVRPVRITLPNNRATRLLTNILVLEGGTSRQADGHEPEVVAGSVLTGAERNGTAGIPATELGDRAGDKDVLAVGGGGNFVESDCYGGGGGARGSAGSSGSFGDGGGAG